MVFVRTVQYEFYEHEKHTHLKIQNYNDSREICHQDMKILRRTTRTTQNVRLQNSIHSAKFYKINHNLQAGVTAIEIEMIEVTCNDRLGKKVRVKCKYPFPELNQCNSLISDLSNLQSQSQLCRMPRLRPIQGLRKYTLSHILSCPTLLVSPTCPSTKLQIFLTCSSRWCQSRL